ncbi:hypothetical protein LINPERHAP2_LOCUS41475, partial [Linum perenne]
ILTSAIDFVLCGSRSGICTSWILVKFSIEQDYLKALIGGVWILLDHYLVVHRWDPSFRVSNDLLKKMVVWVRFPHLPIHFYHGSGSSALGNLIGKMVKIDFTTQTAERGKFSRMAIEINLHKPLLPVVLLDGVIKKKSSTRTFHTCVLSVVMWVMINLAAHTVLVSMFPTINALPALAGVDAYIIPASSTEIYGA